MVRVFTQRRFATETFTKANLRYLLYSTCTLLLLNTTNHFSDPSPVDLINTFFNAMLEFLKIKMKPPIDLENGGEHGSVGELYSDEQLKSFLRNLALKVLSLKVAAYIKWNLSKKTKSRTSKTSYLKLCRSGDYSQIATMQICYSGNKIFCCCVTFIY